MITKFSDIPFGKAYLELLIGIKDIMYEEVFNPLETSVIREVSDRTFVRYTKHLNYLSINKTDSYYYAIDFLDNTIQVYQGWAQPGSIKIDRENMNQFYEAVKEIKQYLETIELVVDDNQA